MEKFTEILNIANDIYLNPELGYKEKRTSDTVKKYILRYMPDANICKFSETGLKVNIGERKKVHIGLIAELDGVFAPSHFHADKTTGAAHNCGHYSQVAILLNVFRTLVETEIYKTFDFSLGFIFVPAEEYLDLEYRKKLREDGKITYFGGKPEAMKLGVFDEFDMCIAVHSMGGVFEKRSIEINCDLAGFMYKNFTFKGKASHAGFAPQAGINAYSISTLFNVALGLLRQQVDERYMPRMNPVILESNMGVNVIPNKIRIGSDIRANSIDYMLELSQRLNMIGKGSALSLGGEVEIESSLGYLPFNQSRYLSTFVKSAFEKFDRIEFCKDSTPVSASGDIGDLAFMIPTIQIGYSGFKGTIHGDDFIHDDVEYIFSIFPEFLIEVLKEMNGKIDKNQLYKRSYKEYEKTIKQFGDSDEK